MECILLNAVKIGNIPKFPLDSMSDINKSPKFWDSI